MASKEHERDNVVYWKTNGKINNDLQSSMASKEHANLFGTNAWPKVMLARINSLQIHYRRLLKRT